MNNLAKRIELIANLSIAIAATLLSIVLVKGYLFNNLNNPKTNTSPAIAGNLLQKGTKISLRNIDWQKNGRTLLLALSTTCHFCTESAPFYQHLVKEHGQAQLIALVPQTVDEGKSYLKNLGVQVDDVRQASPDETGITGTPTLILVDRDGKIANSWVGVLSENSEREVLNQLIPERASK